MNISIIQPFIISLLLGALMGFERSVTTARSEDPDGDIIGGIRTYSLISLFGCISMFIDRNYRPGFLLVSMAAVVLLALAVYAISFYKFNERGLTTEVSILICYTVGVLVSQGMFILSASITVIVVLVLYLKRYMETLSGRITPEDMLAVIKFAIVSLVILPLFNPSVEVVLGSVAGGLKVYKMYPGLESLVLFNPRNVWLMVVLISGIGFTGYVLIKILGSRKGIGLTGLLGGLVSSTATTLTFAKRSLTENRLALSCSLAVLLACSTMFPRVLVEVAIINSSLLPGLAVTLGTMAAAGFVLCFIIWRITGKEKTEDVPLANPFSIMPAVKFGLLYAAIVLITRFISITAGDSGVYIVSVLSGMTDVDAITLTMSNLSKNSPERMHQATVAITLAAFSNTILKFIMAFAIGSRNFRKGIAAGFGVILCSGIAALFFV
ncbi:MAG TPA: MgtC/SapB family protein [Spirochaetota bacterium]|nr:MgtC/SapB family protein [Spirochaetota bacterium]